MGGGSGSKSSAARMLSAADVILIHLPVESARYDELMITLRRYLVNEAADEAVQHPSRTGCIKVNY